MPNKSKNTPAFNAGMVIRCDGVAKDTSPRVIQSKVKTWLWMLQEAEEKPQCAWGQRIRKTGRIVFEFNAAKRRRRVIDASRDGRGEKLCKKDRLEQALSTARSMLHEILRYAEYADQLMTARSDKSVPVPVAPTGRPGTIAIVFGDRFVKMRASIITKRRRIALKEAGDAIEAATAIPAVQAVEAEADKG